MFKWFAQTLSCFHGEKRGVSLTLEEAISLLKISSKVNNEVTIKYPFYCGHLVEKKFCISYIIVNVENSKEQSSTPPPNS